MRQDTLELVRKLLTEWYGPDAITDAGPPPGAPTAPRLLVDYLTLISPTLVFSHERELRLLPVAELKVHDGLLRFCEVMRTGALWGVVPSRKRDPEVVVHWPLTGERAATGPLSAFLASLLLYQIAGFLPHRSSKAVMWGASSSWPFENPIRANLRAAGFREVTKKNKFRTTAVDAGAEAFADLFVSPGAIVVVQGSQAHPEYSAAAKDEAAWDRVVASVNPRAGFGTRYRRGPRGAWKRV